MATKGIYTVPAAARLLQETPAAIHGWAFGYHRRSSRYAAAIRSDVAPLSGVAVLTFVELVELMFIQEQLACGRSWPRLREAMVVARRLLPEEPHPFATKRWFADAAALYLKLGREHDEDVLIELAGHGQVAMEAVLQPYLRQLEFGLGGTALRWFPRGPTAPVVVDPRRAFGMPVALKSGVPTETIAALNRAGDSPSAIAAWYRMDEAEVTAALEFEQSLSRAA